MDKKLENQNKLKWQKSITKLEKYFADIVLPIQPLKLNNHSTITNCTQFVENHLTVVKANIGKQTFLPYLYRLEELKEFLTKTEI